MKLKDFLRIAEYGNENWKGSFSPTEIKENAEIYYADFLWSKENGEVADSIMSLCRNLADDVRENPDWTEPKQWLYQIASELNMIDMDFQDYLETDSWLNEFK